MKKRIDIAIGIDCGTSGVRACALDTVGNLLASTQTPLIEQSPYAWWQATTLVMDKLCFALHDRLNQQGKQIGRCALSFDATSSSVFLMTPDGEPLSDVEMYYQSHPERARTLKTQINAESGAQGANSSLVKVLALAEQLPSGQAWRICHQADWIGQQLTGKVGISDENNVLKLGYDSQKRLWPTEILNLLPEDSLPQVLAPATPFANLRASLTQRWQLPTETQVATGTTDSIAAFLATKANRLGDAVISLGSTLAFKVLTAQPFFDASRGIYSHRLWNQWLVGGASNAGGAVLLDHFSLAQLSALSQQINTESLLNYGYYPLPKQAKGERFPLAHPEQRPQLTPTADNETLFLQAMLEGLVDIEKTGWAALEQISGQKIQRLFACGGGTKNPAWTGIRNQLLPYPTATPFSQEAAVGSALLALKSMGSVSANHCQS